jgi:hypothetical protein
MDLFSLETLEIIRWEIKDKWRRRKKKNIKKTTPKLQPMSGLNNEKAGCCSLRRKDKEDRGG